MTVKIHGIIGLPWSLSGKEPARQWRSESESQSCLTLCDSMDYTVHAILQARLLEWAAFPFSRGSSQPKDWTGDAGSIPDPRRSHMA